MEQPGEDSRILCVHQVKCGFALLVRNIALLLLFVELGSLVVNVLEELRDNKCPGTLAHSPTHDPPMHTH